MQFTGLVMVRHKASSFSSWTQFKRHLHSRYESFQRASRLFQPQQISKKATGKEEEITSRSLELLTRSGYIRQSSSGIFHILPLCQRVLDKMAAAIDLEMAAIGANRMTMPSLVRDTLWKQSGRLVKMGAELMSVSERTSHRLVLSPTHEEAVTQLVGSVSPVPGRQLPLRLYQITAKFRDEKRPRFGLLRCKEFLMKDLYTFDATEEAARDTYREVTEAYRAVFQRLGIPTVRVRGDSGVMGGGLSHEFHVLSPAGEDWVWLRPECDRRLCPAAANVEVDGDSGADAGDTRTCPACGLPVQRHAGIEVGHTFLLGSAYSAAFGAVSETAGGGRQPLQMGCYGVGVTRLLAAALETAAAAAEEELHWPLPIAPYKLCLIPPKAGSREAAAADWAWRAVHQLAAQPWLQGDLLVDDRDHLTIGQRVREARRSGHPRLLVFGREAAGGGERPPRAELLQGREQSFLEEQELVPRLTELLSKS